MSISDQQRIEFEMVCRPIIKWLCENMHPHALVIIDPISAVLYEGAVAVNTIEYVVD